MVRIRPAVRVLAAGMAAALAAVAPAAELPQRLLAGLVGARTLTVRAAADGGFAFALEAEVDAALEGQTLTLLRGRTVAPTATLDGGRKGWVFTEGAGGAWFAGGETAGDSTELKLLVGPGNAAKWRVDFRLPAESVAGGQVAFLDLGPHRPVLVKAAPGVGVVGVHGGQTPQGGVEGLLGSAGGLGLYQGGDAAALDALVRARLRPPGHLVIDARYRVTLETAVARCLVRDMATHPGPRLTLRTKRVDRVLGVRELTSGRPVFFRHEGERLSLHPGPGPGPRYFVVDLAGPGPRTYGVEAALPVLLAPEDGRQQLGRIALDSRHPGPDGSLLGRGARVELREGKWTRLREAFGTGGYELFEASVAEPRIAISEPPQRLRKMRPDLEVDTRVMTGWAESTRLTLTTPREARWQAVTMRLPPGARDPRAFRGSEAVALVRENAIGEDGWQPIRLWLESGDEVIVSYRRHGLAGGETAVELALPRFDVEVGKTEWSIEAPSDYLVGRPQLTAESKKSLAPPPAAPAPTGAAVPASGGPAAPVAPHAGRGDATPWRTPFGAAPPPAAPHEMQREAAGSFARVLPNQLEVDQLLEVRVALHSRRVVHQGHVVFFLAGLCVLGWVLLGMPRAGGGFLVGVAGVGLLPVAFAMSRLNEVNSPWMRALLAGGLFAVFLRAIWWGAAEAGALFPAEPEGPAKTGGDGGAGRVASGGEAPASRAGEVGASAAKSPGSDAEPAPSGPRDGDGPAPAADPAPAES